MGGGGGGGGGGGDWTTATSNHLQGLHQVGAGPIFSRHVRVNQWSDFFGRGRIFSGHRSRNVCRPHLNQSTHMLFWDIANAVSDWSR